MANGSHWETIKPYFQPDSIPTWVTGEDQDRLAAYDMYDAIFWTAPQSFQILLRGQEGEPIYVPSGRKIVETAHRFMAPGFQVVTTSLTENAPQAEEAALFFSDFASRERFFSKFSANKLSGLRRGDWLWHIFADAERLEGSRVSIFPIDPSTYFPEYANGDEIENIVAIHLVESAMNGDKPAVRKLTYRKETGVGGPSPITMREVLCPIEEWGQPGTDMVETIVQTLLPEEVLPAEIDSIPVYHIPNVYDPEMGWGSSEMRGIERLMKAINQSVTDEDITLVLEGLGVYTTTAGAPIDEDTGEELPWELGPARVVELPQGHNFNRVNGAGSVAPYQDHIKYLHDQLDETVGANDVTRGRVEVAVAESGIALAIRMSPMLARMAEKELVVTDVHNQMLFDLRKWFIAFEGMGGLEEIRWTPVYGDKLPSNKKQQFDEIMAMATAQPPIISTAEARRRLSAIGFVFADDAALVAEIAGEAAATADAIASRIDAGITAP